MPTNANLVVTAAARMELLDIVADFGGTASAGTVQPNGDFYFELTAPVEALEPIDALDGVPSSCSTRFRRWGGASSGSEKDSGSTSSPTGAPPVPKG